MYLLSERHVKASCCYQNCQLWRNNKKRQSETSQSCFTEQTSQTSASRLGRLSRAEAALGANSDASEAHSMENKVNNNSNYWSRWQNANIKASPSASRLKMNNWAGACVCGAQGSRNELKLFQTSSQYVRCCQQFQRLDEKSCNHEVSYSSANGSGTAQTPKLVVKLINIRP